MTMFIQFLLNSLLATCLYCVAGLGAHISMRGQNFFNFTYAAAITMGAYAMVASHVYLPAFFSAMVGIIVACLVMGLSEQYLFRSLRQMAAPPLVLLLASLGLYVVLQNLASLVYGDAPKVLHIGYLQESLSLKDARLTRMQYFIVLVTVWLAISIPVLVMVSGFGKKLRAMASDEYLCVASGVNCEGLRLRASFLTGALAGIAGILLLLDVNAVPSMGLQFFMMGIIAVVIGGVQDIRGVFLGAAVLGFSQHFGVMRINTRWQYAVPFLVLMAFLTFRPRGFLGKRMERTVE